MPTPKTVLNIHPKVFTSLLINLAVALVAAIGAWATPEVFADFGPWAVPLSLVVANGAGSLGAWLKSVKADESSAAPAAQPEVTATVTADTSTVSVVLPPDPEPEPAATATEASEPKSSPLAAQSSVL